MPKYSVTGTVTGGKYLGEFEADTKEEAIDIALKSEEAHISLCHSCARQVEYPAIEGVTAEEVDSGE